MPAEVDVRHLRKNYGNVAALHDLNLQIEAGEIFGLLGANGAGKTTAVECMVGLREADAGEILIGGSNIRRQSTEAKRRIGVVLQSTSLPDHLTPAEALTLFGSLYGRPTSASALLQRFGLTAQANARFASLSGGQRQRLALALAFVNQPSLVVLDEPTNGLDAHARRELHDDILRIKSEGHTVLLTTHDLSEAERLCDRVAILDRGRVVVIGSPRELIARASGHHTITLQTDRAIERTALAKLAGVSKVTSDGLTAHLSTNDSTQTIQALLPLLAGASAELVELHLRRASLEEVFLGLIENSSARNAEAPPS
ncbi:MAG: ABC transporter ATP-binding protein [Lacunisphaera sp.]